MIARLIMLVFCLSCPSLGWAATWYAGPTGSGTNCTFGSPCTIAQGLATVAPGDTLILKNGTYAASAQVLSWAGTRSGSVCSAYKGGTSDAARVTIQAETDGGVIVNGDFVRETMRWDCVQYVTVIGVRIQDSLKSVISLVYSPNNTFQRISAYNANYYPFPSLSACPGALNNNFHVMEITLNSNYTIVEDSIFGGTGRDLYNTYRTDHNIFRRSVLIGGGWALENYSPYCGTIGASQHGEPLQVYGSSDNVVENVIAYSPETFTGKTRYTPQGFIVWVNLGEVGHRNKLLGTIAINIQTYSYYNSSNCNATDADACLTDTLFENIVAYQYNMGAYIYNGRNINVNYATFLGGGEGASAGGLNKTGLYLHEGRDADLSSNYLLKNILVANNDMHGCYATTTLQTGDAVINYGLFYDNTIANYSTDCTNKVTKTNITTGVNPALDSIAYVKTASPAATVGESGGRVGADTRCRYISTFSGTNVVTVHTNESLWPLPDFINERTKTETLAIHGVSYDPNALVLDALGPRDTPNIGCPDAEVPEDPAIYASAAGTNSLTFDHTIPAGTDQALVCISMWHTGANVGEVSAVTIGGEALTRLSGGRVVTSPAYRAGEIWGRATPLTGTRSVAVTTVGNVGEILATSMALDPWVSTGAVVSSAGLGTAVSTTATTTATDQVIDCLTMSALTNSITGPGQTLQTSIAFPAVSLKLNTSTQPGSAGGEMSHTLSSNNYFAHLAVSSAGGTPPTSTFRVTKWKASTLHGSIATPEVAIGEHGTSGANVYISAGGALRIRTEIKVETAPSVLTGANLYCKKNAGSFFKITETYGSAPVRFIGNIPINTLPNPGAATTQQLSAGTYTAHEVVRLQSQAVVLPVIPTNNLTETDWLIEVDSGLASNDTVTCEVWNNSGAQIGTHTVTPTFTVRAPAASAGF